MLYRADDDRDDLEIHWVKEHKPYKYIHHHSSEYTWNVPHHDALNFDVSYTGYFTFGDAFVSIHAGEADVYHARLAYSSVEKLRLKPQVLLW
jgi:hypothetical protein